MEEETRKERTNVQHSVATVHSAFGAYGLSISLSPSAAVCWHTKDTHDDFGLRTTTTSLSTCELRVEHFWLFLGCSLDTRRSILVNPNVPDTCNNPAVLYDSLGSKLNVGSCNPGDRTISFVGSVKPNDGTPEEVLETGSKIVSHLFAHRSAKWNSLPAPASPTEAWY